jgi:hypothetical protein
VFVAGLLLPAVVRAQIAQEYQVKAAFVYNFTKFVEWPPQSSNGPQVPFTICTLGKNPLVDALAEAVKGKRAAGRAIMMRAIKGKEEARGCHILFIGFSERKQLRSILDETSGRNVLTIGDMDGFTAEGGVINLKLDSEKIRIQVNLHAADKQQLQISSKLLGLAEIVVGH